MTKKINTKPTAFSLIELSIVILIIGLIISGIVGARKLIALSNISKARALTNSSPVNGIEDLILWLESTSKNSFATNGSTSDGTIITEWNDINPQQIVKNNAIQSNTAKKPTYKEAAINGLPAVNFDGVTTVGQEDSMVSNANIDYTVNPNITIFAVYILNSGGNSHQVLLGQDDGAWDRFIYINEPLVANRGVSTGSGRFTVNGISDLNTPRILSFVAQNGVTNGSSAYINGANTNGVFTESHDNSGNMNLTIGNVGQTASSYPAKIYLGELIIYSRALSDFERQQIEQYLAKKWSVKLT